MLAGTLGMERRQEYGVEGGVAGKDRRDCKQEGRREAREEATGERVRRPHIFRCGRVPAKRL